MNDLAAVQTAHRLLTDVSEGALATLTDEGAPLASLVTFAVDAQNQPLLLLSKLARHTRNLTRDPRASLLIVEPSDGDAQTRARITLSGHVTLVDPTQSTNARKNFLQRHPAAATYVDFADFQFYAMSLTRLHVVEGFGRIADLPATALTS
jgi:putative heme iron utilization protein